MFKYLKFRQLLTGLFLLFAMNGHAKHIIGGTLSYECLGQTVPGFNKYRFTMRVYRDCFGGGATFDAPAEMAIYRGTAVSNVMVKNFQVFFDQERDIVPDTPRCVQTVPSVCVQEAVYVFEEVLAISATESYFVVYQRCCRNESIVNLINPGDIGATFSIELTPAAQAVCNNSPTFDAFPPIIICNGLPLEFDHRATDVDGDFLVYSFCPPLEGGGNILSQPGVFTCDGAVPTPPCGPPFSNVPFVVPNYTPTSPMGGNPTVSINTGTGVITGTPNLNGQFVVAVCVKEFRNGALLSTSQREFQFNVTDCNASVVALIDTAVLSGGLYEINACGDKEVRIFNKSKQKSNINQFYWNFSGPGGFTLVDSSSWEVLTIPFPVLGTYSGTLILNPNQECSDTARLRVNVFPEVHADFSYAYDTCIAGPVVFTDLSSGEGVIDTWDWDFGVDNGFSGLQNPAYLYPIPGFHDVKLEVTDRNNCKDALIKTIKWYPVPPLIIISPNSYLACVPQAITFTNLSSPIDNTYDILWDFGDGTTISGVISPTHTYTVPGTYTVKVDITSPIGCFTTRTFPDLMQAKPSPVADFSISPDTLLSNLNNVISFTDQSQNVNRWNWTFGREGTANIQNPVHTFRDTGRVAVRLIATHPQGCQDSLTKYLDIRPAFTWFMPNAFTPNSDGTNELFRGSGFTFGVTDFNMQIWNRWGEMVFETNNLEAGWDGQIRDTGEWAPQGVYVYVVSFTAPRGERQVFKGYATLIR
jgi:gliding motility-associated-like protein